MKDMMRKVLRDFLATVAVLAFLVCALAGKAHADTLDHSVQIVSGAEINAQALVNEVSVHVGRAIGGGVDVITEVFPLRSTVTIRVMVTGRNVGFRNFWRIRMIIERAIRADGVARNGYSNRPQHPTRAFRLL